VALIAMGGVQHESGYKIDPETGKQQKCSYIELEGRNLKLLCWADVSGWWIEATDEEMEIPGPETMGQLRRLCAVLGVELKEGE
jgi:hypothetical protein